jgi:hypothetical protein
MNYIKVGLVFWFSLGMAEEWTACTQGHWLIEGHGCSQCPQIWLIGV